MIYRYITSTSNTSLSVGAPAQMLDTSQTARICNYCVALMITKRCLRLGSSTVRVPEQILYYRKTGRVSGLIFAIHDSST